MWAQFFISPLMKSDSVDREMEAVDSEFNNFKAGDDARKMQIVIECLVKEGHPMANFMLGNIKSLKDNLPEGITAYEELHKWYPKNYSSRWMNLVVQLRDRLFFLGFLKVKIRPRYKVASYS